MPIFNCFNGSTARQFSSSLQHESVVPDYHHVERHREGGFLFPLVDLLTMRLPRQQSSATISSANSRPGPALHWRLSSQAHSCRVVQRLGEGHWSGRIGWALGRLRSGWFRQIPTQLCPNPVGNSEKLRPQRWQFHLWRYRGKEAAYVNTWRNDRP